MTKVVDLIAYKNGEYLPIKDIGPSVLDFGFIHCDATYDVMKTSNGKILFYDLHKERYENSCEYFGFTPIERIDEIVKELLDINKIDNAFIWLCNWRGTPPSGSPRDMSGPEHQVVYVKPYYNISSEPVSLLLHTANRRTPDKTVPQTFKNFSWIELTRAQKHADKENYDSAIVLDTEGFVAEGPGFGICMVKGNTVYTPANNVLDSITVKVVQKLCEELGLFFVKANIKPEHILDADEVFICSTSGGITPVNAINNKLYANRTITDRLIEKYNASF